MAAAAGLVGALLMNICTNYQAIINGTQPGGELATTEQGSGWKGRISEVTQCTGMFWGSSENSTPTKRTFLEFRRRDIYWYLSATNNSAQMSTQNPPREDSRTCAAGCCDGDSRTCAAGCCDGDSRTCAAGCCDGDKILCEVRTEAQTSLSLSQQDTYSTSPFRDK